MTDTRSIAELAAATAAEIQRRGWVTNLLYEVDEDNPELREGYDPAVYKFDENGDLDAGGGYSADGEHWSELPYSSAAVANSRVCSLGGMGAVFYGDCTKGDVRDGNGYDTFVKTVADKILPDWEGVIRGEGQSWAYPRYHRPSSVIAEWNDGDLESPTYGWPASISTVIKVFTDIAAEQTA